MSASVLLSSPLSISLLRDISSVEAQLDQLAPSVGKTQQFEEDEMAPQRRNTGKIVAAADTAEESSFQVNTAAANARSQPP